MNNILEKLTSARQFLYHAARLVDENHYNGLPVSMAKVNAIKTAEWAIAQLFQYLPMKLVLDNPWILKILRDMHCWEFMEGTSAILMQHVKNNLHTLVG